MYYVMVRICLPARIRSLKNHRGKRRRREKKRKKKKKKEKPPIEEDFEKKGVESLRSLAHTSSSLIITEGKKNWT